MTKILVVDDDESIVELLKINLKLIGHDVITAYDGIKAYALAQQELPDLIILDVMMPNVDGFTTAQKIRNNPATEHIPILMLTALSMLDDKVKGFNSGVDDYLVKPFELEELKLRVRALLKRTNALPPSLAKPEILSIGDITLDPDNLTVIIKNKNIKLTPIEFDIMSILVQHNTQTVQAPVFLREIWGYSEDDEVKTVRVHIRHLRSKIEKTTGQNGYIETVYGGGYKLNPSLK
ncbi:MAG: response regulator transcription factor [Candidatus Gastranaerophilales bacterium]|nr:response regulator transcription factor [Candidatus Gastranaerophilales bacterium]